MFDHVNVNENKIDGKLPDGYYACTESNGDIIIRNLKEESKQWGERRSEFWEDNNTGEYPFAMGYNFQYIEIHHWGESSPYTCDYEKKGFIYPQLD